MASSNITQTNSDENNTKTTTSTNTKPELLKMIYFGKNGFPPNAQIITEVVHTRREVVASPEQLEQAKAMNLDLDNFWSKPIVNQNN